jgi:Flp pilus assembly pilin Flp
MKRIIATVRALFVEEHGIAASEYALMLGLIALILFVVIRIFGSNLRNYWTNVNSSVFSQ